MSHLQLRIKSSVPVVKPGLAGKTPRVKPLVAPGRRTKSTEPPEEWDDCRTLRPLAVESSELEPELRKTIRILRRLGFRGSDEAVVERARLEIALQLKPRTPNGDLDRLRSLSKWFD